MRSEVRAGRREAAGDRGARSVCGGGLDWNQGTGSEAYVEHLVHVRDAGGVEAQRLVERRRLLSSRKEGMRCGAR